RDCVRPGLGVELRVYLAQSAVLGSSPGVRRYRYTGTDFNHVPSTATPEEFWKYYQDHRTTLRVEMLPIKVADFLDKVGPTPTDAATEQALKDLFEHYKDNVPHPLRDEPAFQEPRRIGVEWVAPGGDWLHARQQAERFVQAVLAGSPGNPFPALSLMANVVETYDRAKDFSYAMPGLTESSFDLAFYREPNKPVDVTALLGQAMGAIATGAPPETFATAYVQGVRMRSGASASPDLAREIQRRAGIKATIVLAGQNPWLAAGLLDYASRGKQPLPLE